MPPKTVKLFKERSRMEFQEFFSVQLKIFKNIGFSFNESIEPRRFTLATISCCMYFLLMFLRLVNPNLSVESRFEAIELLLNDIDILVKSFLIVWNKAEIWMILTTLNELFDAPKPSQRSQLKLIRSWRLVHVWVLIAIGTYIFCVVAPCLATLYIFITKNQFIGLVPILRSFPVTPWTYIPVCVFNVCCMTPSAFLMLASDAMTLIIFAHVSHQFRQIAQRIESFEGGRDKLKEIVERHCSIFELVFFYGI